MPVDPAPITGVIRDSGLGALVQAGTPALSANWPAAGVNAYGQLMASTEGAKPTYSASWVGLVSAAAATDIIQMTVGSRTVRILRFELSGTAGTAVNCPVYAVIRPTASTAGTPATGLALPIAGTHDSGANPASTAVLTAWTANPTVTSTGQLVVRAGSLLLPVPAATTVSGVPLIAWDFTNRNGQGLVLRANSARAFCINLNGTTVTTDLLYGSIEWTED